jgi:hypothetical protein
LRYIWEQAEKGKTNAFGSVLLKTSLVTKKKAMPERHKRIPFPHKKGKEGNERKTHETHKRG